MAIIRCQACGKPNPDFLETCQYCEARLSPVTSAPGAADETLIRPAAGTVRCQACGRSNPDHLENCQYCEARLKPMLAAPATPDPAASEAEAPADPLARLRSTQAFVPDPAEPEAEAEAPDEPPAPDWMSRLRGVGGAEVHGEPEPDWMLTQPANPTAEGDQPDWLREEPPPPANAPRAASDDEELPDWLANLRTSAGAPTPPAPPAPEPPELFLPDFPAEAPLTPAASAEDDMPEWLRDQLAPKPAPPPAPPLRVRKKLTDWLTPGAPEAAEPAEPAPEAPDEAAPEAEAPAALPGTPAAADETLVPASKPRRKKMTDWLTPGESGLPAQIPAPKPTEPEAELPDWLKAMQPTEDVPDWLRDVANAPRSFGRAGTPPEAPAMPGQGDEPPAVTPPPASAARTADDDLPDWLQALRESPTPAPTEPEAQDTLPSARRQQELPSWLKGATGLLPEEPEAEPTPAEPGAGPALAEPALPEAALTEAALPEAPLPEAPPPWAALPEMGQPEASLPDVAASVPPAPAAPAWLQPAPDEPEPEPEPEAPAAEPGAYELPDWLRPSPEALAEAEAEQAAEPPVDAAALNAAELAAAEEALPDWLRNLQAQTSEAETEAPARPDYQPEPDVPDWLRPAAPPASPPEPPELLEGDNTLAPGQMPEWLQAMQSPVVPTPTVPAGGAPADLPPLDDETLAWLTASAARPEEPAEAVPSAPAAPWLDEAAASEPARLEDSADSEPAAEPTAVEDMPDWLKALRGVPTQEQQSAEAMPDWLRTLRGIPPRPATATTAEPPPAPTLPDEHEAPVRESAATSEDEALPSWLAAMRPTDVQHPADAEADAYEENVGVLAGMRGVLRAEPTVAQPRKSASPVPRLVVAETHAAQAKALAALLAEEEAARPPAKQAARLGQYLERWFVFLILALAILIPQFALPDMFAAPASISREAKSAFDAVNLAPANQPALVAFEYDPAQQGELSPGALAIVTHLMSRGVPVVGVSTRPMGAAVAQTVLTQAAADLGARAQANYVYGSQYLNLGYISGGPVGLLQFAAAPQSVFQADFTGAGPRTALWTQPILRGVDTLGDFGLVVLVTAAPDDTRAWIEQSQNYAAGIPRLAVVSAGAEPMVRPYIEGQAPQLDGLVSGLIGAAQYERQAGLPGLASSHWSALGGGLWAALLLIAGGNAVYAAIALVRRRRR